MLEGEFCLLSYTVIVKIQIGPKSMTVLISLQNNENVKRQVAVKSAQMRKEKQKKLPPAALLILSSIHLEVLL